MGGDFNISPEQLVETRFDRRVGATIFHTETERGTFRTTKARSTIDFFLVSDRLAAAVEKVSTVEATGVRCHVPVQLTFQPRLASLRALHVRQPPRLGVERVYGPLPPPPDWELPKAVATAALEAARADVADFDDILEAAYAAWADMAEEEIGNNTGLHAIKTGERSRRPKLVWRSVLPENKSIPSFSYPAAMTWLRGIVSEIQRVTGVAAAAARAGDGSGTREAAEPAGVDTRPAYDDLTHVYCHAEDDAPDDAHPAEDDEGSRNQRDDRERRARRPPESWRHCADVLADITASLTEDAPGGDLKLDYIDMHREVVQMIADMRNAMRRPNELGPISDEDGNTNGHHDARWPKQVAVEVARMAPEADDLRERLDSIVAAAEAGRKADDDRSWRAWIWEDFDAGARRAHAFSRLPQEVTPDAVPGQGAAMTSTPEAPLDPQRNKFRARWRPANGPFRYHWPTRSELAQLTPARLREVAQTVSYRNAQTDDGFHPRQLACLSDEALLTLSIILQAVEVSGRWPRQVSMVITPLIPKPKGGFRPIGLLPAIYRLWAKARRDLADRWEADHRRAFLSSARGNGPIDTMWRMTARQEAGVARDDQAGVIAEDLAAFFETIDRNTLMREAEVLGYPIPLLRGALGAYSAARLLTLQGRVGRELYPTVGVIAGCSLAMSLTKLFYLRALDTFVSRLPPTVTLDIHVDDVTLSAIGPPVNVAAELTTARDALARVMSDLGCTFAEGKTAVTATSRQLTNLITRRNGISDETSAIPCLLGVDNVAGARRARLKTSSKRAARLKAALARKARLRRIRAIVGRKAGRIFRSGVLPAAAYDAAIWGLTDAECIRIRRIAAVAMSPRAKGRSLSMVHVWHGLPTADAEHAPVITYAKMIWRAMTRREEASMRASSLADLNAMWNAASINFIPIVNRVAAARRADGTIPAPVARKAWGDIRGPIGAAALTLTRLGWEFASPFILRDPDGVEHSLTNSSPCLTRDLMRDALRANLERKIGATLARDETSFEGRRACLDLAINASRPTRGISRHQSAAFRAVACGAIWTAVKAKERGYDIDGLCAVCRMAPDTIRHRTYGCDGTREAVKAAVPRWFWEEAQRCGAHTPFWTTAVVPHPVDVAPKPRQDLYCEVEHHSAEALAASDHSNRMHITGRVYVDGSCAPSVFRGLARASLALVTQSRDGAPYKTLRLPVPRHLPQTSQAAEHLVVGVAYDGIRGAAELVGDCLNVVRSYAASAAMALRPTMKYAGIVLSSYRNLTARRQTTVRWTKAHKTLNGTETAEEERDVRGNAAADAAAKEALHLHPPLGADVTADINFYTKRAPHVVKAVTAAMEMFPRAPTNMPRVPRPASATEARSLQRHLWRHKAGTWRCEVCDDFITARRMPTYRRHQQCSGKSMADSAATFAAAGHSLIRAQSDLPFVMCSRCGAWGNRRTRHLGQRCAAPTQAGRQAITRVLKGQHPLLQRQTDGSNAPRATVRITAAYDPLAAAWVPVHQTANQHNEDSMDTHTPGGSDGTLGSNNHIMEVSDLAAADHDVPERPPSVMDDGMSDADVFGHGGGFDEFDAMGADSEELVHRFPVNDAMGTERDRAQAPETGSCCETTSVQPAGGAVTATTSRRRQREGHDNGIRNFAAEAIFRLGNALTRRDTDPQGRMERLRRRIAAKANSERTDQRSEQAPTQASDRPHDEGHLHQIGAQTAHAERGAGEGSEQPQPPPLQPPCRVRHPHGERNPRTTGTYGEAACGEEAATHAPQGPHQRLHPAPHDHGPPLHDAVRDRIGGHQKDGGCHSAQGLKRHRTERHEKPCHSPRHALQRHGAGRPRTDGTGIDTVTDDINLGNCRSDSSNLHHTVNAASEHEGSKGGNGGAEAPSARTRGVRRGRSGPRSLWSPSPPRCYRRTAGQSAEPQRGIRPHMPSGLAQVRTRAELVAQLRARPFLATRTAARPRDLGHAGHSAASDGLSSQLHAMVADVTTAAKGRTPPTTRRGARNGLEAAQAEPGSGTSVDEHNGRETWSSAGTAMSPSRAAADSAFSATTGADPAASGAAAAPLYSVATRDLCAASEPAVASHARDDIACQSDYPAIGTTVYSTAANTQLAVSDTERAAADISRACSSSHPVLLSVPAAVDGNSTSDHKVVAAHAPCGGDSGRTSRVAMPNSPTGSSHTAVNNRAMPPARRRLRGKQPPPRNGDPLVPAAVTLRPATSPARRSNVATGRPPN